jgi:hypothetical protein
MGDGQHTDRRQTDETTLAIFRIFFTAGVEKKVSEGDSLSVSPIKNVLYV